MTLSREALAIVSTLHPTARRVAGGGLAFIAVGIIVALVGVARSSPFLGPLGWKKPTAFGLSFGLKDGQSPVFGRARPGGQPAWVKRPAPSKIPTP